MTRNQNFIECKQPTTHRYNTGQAAIENVYISMNLYENSLEIELSIANCRPTGDKWQSKTLFLSIFNPRSSIVKSVYDCRLSGVVTLWKHESLIWPITL